MKRLILLIVGFLVACLGTALPARADAFTPWSDPVHQYTYDLQLSFEPTANAVSERGPPTWEDFDPAYDCATRRAPSQTALQQRVCSTDVECTVARRACVAAKAGPGAWGTAAESMSSRAAAYQARITGRSAGSVYNVNGVKFDGFANGVLQEAKGPGYARFVSNGQFRPWFSGADSLASQAQRQIGAAGGTPITWSVAEADAVTAINNLFVSRGISGINVMHVP